MIPLSSIFNPYGVLTGLSRLAGTPAVQDEQPPQHHGTLDKRPTGSEYSPRKTARRGKNKVAASPHKQPGGLRPGAGSSVQAAAAAARALHAPQSPAPDDAYTAQGMALPGLPPSTEADVGPAASTIATQPDKGDPRETVSHEARLAEYKVPTFVDAQGWTWMAHNCVSRYVLLENLAERTKTSGHDGGALEAHAMGMLYNSAVHLWRRGENGAMHADIVGPKVVATHERTHLEQHIICEGDRWALYDPTTEQRRPVSSRAPDTLYAALWQGYEGREATPEDIVQCRRKLAALMLEDNNRAQFAERALQIAGERLMAYVKAHPEDELRLRDEIRSFKPGLVPCFTWDGETWPHPDCAASYDLMNSLVRPMTRMGAWGSELEAEAVANAMGWRVHLWKPRDDASRSWWSPKTYERLVVYGPENGEVMHVVNIIDNRHYAQFIPESRTESLRPQSVVRSAGEVIDCGGGGDCLYLSILGEGSKRHEVKALRREMVDYIRSHRHLYESVAREAADVRWQDFQASEPRRAAAVAKRAEDYRALQLQANR